MSMSLIEYDIYSKPTTNRPQCAGAYASLHAYIYAVYMARPTADNSGHPTDKTLEPIIFIPLPLLV